MAQASQEPAQPSLSQILFEKGKACQLGKGLEQDLKKAADYHAQACKLGEGRSCAELASIYHGGFDHPIDVLSSGLLYARAGSALTVACSRDDGEACQYLAMLYLECPWVKADFARAHRLLLSACELNSASGCLGEAMLKVMGKAGKTDADQIRALLEKAYKLDESVAVFALSKLVAHGMGQKPDRARAAAMLEKSCQAGQAQACAGQGLTLLAQEDPAQVPRALKLLEQGCEGGVPEACVALADEHSHDFNSNPDHLLKTFALYRRACWGGYSMGCVGLGGITITAGRATP